MAYKDYMIRATAANDSIRAFAVVTKNIVEKERIANHYSPIATAAIGRLLSGGVMMGDMLRNESDVLTLQVRGDGPLGSLIVTSNNKGEVRGCVQNGDVDLPPNASGHLNVGAGVGKGTLMVLMDLGLREPYMSQLSLQTGEIAEDLTYYFAQSEQTPSSVGLGVLFDKEETTVKASGGYIVQLMPDTKKEVIDRLEENISKINGITDILRENNTPEALLEKVLEGFDIQIHETKDVYFRCDCSYKKGEHILHDLGKSELEDMIKENKPVEITCAFCGKKYEYSIEDVEKIRKTLD